MHALTIPLPTKADDTKYGKTDGDAVWLSADLMPPREFCQFWLNRPDTEIPGMLRVFTFRSRAEIGALEEAIRDRSAAGEGSGHSPRT